MTEKKGGVPVRRALLLPPVHRVRTSVKRSSFQIVPLRALWAGLRGAVRVTPSRVKGVITSPGLPWFGPLEVSVSGRYTVVGDQSREVE
jgi:hypothetical protein